MAEIVNEWAEREVKKISEALDEWNDMLLKSFSSEGISKIWDELDIMIQKKKQEVLDTIREEEDIYKTFNGEELHFADPQKENFKIIKEGNREYDSCTGVRFWIFKHPFGKVRESKHEVYIEELFRIFIDVTNGIDSYNGGVGRPYGHTPVITWGFNHVLVSQNCGLDV